MNTTIRVVANAVGVALRIDIRSSWVAVIGLLVNIVSAALLSGGNSHYRAHHHAHSRALCATFKYHPAA